MKKIGFFIILSIFVIFLITPVVLSATTRGINVVSKHGQSLYLYKDCQALVIGVSNYAQWPKLPNAVKDAVDVSERLKRMGILVKLVLDPTYREMKTALSDMVYEMGNERDRGILFYYAGHGETETLADGRKMGYIIPRDCPLIRRDPRGFANHAISMREIESVSLKIKSKHVLMLFDSCFSGALFALVRAVPDDITEKSTLPVRQFITAGREDEEVPDQSMFKRCLLIGLEGDADLSGDGYITGSELGMYLSNKVVNYTHRQQHPQYGKINNPGLDRGDFIFITSRAQAKEEKKRSREESLANQLEEMSDRLKKNEGLVEQMKGLLEAKSSAELKETKLLREKAELEKKIRLSEKARERNRLLMEAKIEDLENKRKVAEEKVPVAVAAKKIPEPEIQRLRSEVKMTTIESDKTKSLQAGKEQLVYVPKEVKDAKIVKLKLELRHKPLIMLESDIEEMILNHNFYLKNTHETGFFRNDFVDNGDGSITDKSTGLMWEKGGSSYQRGYHEIENHLNDLNEDTFLGYNDWRIPTLEELCSLMGKKVEKTGLYTDPVFNEEQNSCWSADKSTNQEMENAYYVDFSDGVIILGYGRNEGSRYEIVEAISYVKAVRSIR
jgi:hypothetical protein